MANREIYIEDLLENTGKKFVLPGITNEGHLLRFFEVVRPALKTAKNRGIEEEKKRWAEVIRKKRDELVEKYRKRGEPLGAGQVSALTDIFAEAVEKSK